jgi:hypothetical protein
MTPPDPGPTLPAERAFVLQFESNCGFERDLRGRVEHVACGCAPRSRGRDELESFLAEVLREVAAKAGEAQ